MHGRSCAELCSEGAKTAVMQPDAEEGQLFCIVLVGLMPTHIYGSHGHGNTAHALCSAPQYSSCTDAGCMAIGTLHIPLSCETIIATPGCPSYTL